MKLEKVSPVLAEILFLLYSKILQISNLKYMKPRLPQQIPAFDLTKASEKFQVAMSDGLGGDAFTRMYIISPLTLTLGQEQTQSLPSILYII